MVGDAGLTDGPLSGVDRPRARQAADVGPPVGSDHRRGPQVTPSVKPEPAPAAVDAAEQGEPEAPLPVKQEEDAAADRAPVALNDKQAAEIEFLRADAVFWQQQEELHRKIVAKAVVKAEASAARARAAQERLAVLNGYRR